MPRLSPSRASRPPSPSHFNSLIASCARTGLTAEAFSVLARMLATDISPTKFTFTPILSSTSAGPSCAAQLHPYILKSRLLHSDPYSGTALLGFFARKGRFGDALNVFEEMPARSVITWNCLISSFAQYGRTHDAMFWFRELVRSGDGFSDGSLVAILPAFGLPEQAHALVKKIALDSFSIVANSLLNLYFSFATCMAEKLFDELTFRDVVSWNTMIAAFARSNSPERAFKLFLSMQRHTVLPTEATLSGVLYACTRINADEHGQLVHAKAIKCNLNISVFVSTSLVYFYAKCVSWRDAHKVLEEVPENSTACWNALISGHSDSNVPIRLVILRDMLRSGTRPNEVSFSSLLKDPSLLDLLQIHSLITRLWQQ